MSKALICDRCGGHIVGGEDSNNRVIVTLTGEDGHPSNKDRSTVFDYHRKCFPPLRKALRERVVTELQPSDR